MPWLPLSSIFVQTDPTTVGNRDKSTSSLKADLTQANARIHLVETHARDGDLYKAFLEDQLANSQENLYYASAKIKEHEADILEVTESLRQRDETIANYQTDRISPESILSMQTDSSIQPLLKTVASKNSQITAFNTRQNTSTVPETTSSNDAALALLVAEISKALADMATHMRISHQVMDSSALLAHNFGSYISELSSAGARGILDFFITVLDNADNIHRTHSSYKQKSTAKE